MVWVSAETRVGRRWISPTLLSVRRCGGERDAQKCGSCAPCRTPCAPPHSLGSLSSPLLPAPRATPLCRPRDIATTPSPPASRIYTVSPVSLFLLPPLSSSSHPSHLLFGNDDTTTNGYQAAPLNGGVWTPLATPFLADEEIDYAAWKTHVLRLAGSGSGLVIMGTNGEAIHLSTPERFELVRPHASTSPKPVSLDPDHRWVQARALSRRRLPTVAMRPERVRMQPS